MEASEKNLPDESRRLLSLLRSHHAEVQAQLVEQSVGMAMLPKGVLDSLRRATEISIASLREEDETLQSAIHVLLTGAPGCLEAAMEILTGSKNSLHKLEYEVIGRVLH